MKKVIAILSFVLLNLPFTIMAHPGHGTTGGYTITHYFVEPSHVVISLSVTIAMFLYIRHLSRSKQPH